MIVNEQKAIQIGQVFFREESKGCNTVVDARGCAEAVDRLAVTGVTTFGPRTEEKSESDQTCYISPYVLMYIKVYMWSLVSPLCVEQNRRHSLQTPDFVCDCAFAVVVVTRVVAVTCPQNDSQAHDWRFFTETKHVRVNVTMTCYLQNSIDV